MSVKTAARSLKMRVLPLLLLAGLILAGCIRQRPQLTGAPTPSPTPTPPLPTIRQALELEGERRDAMGALILDDETHYERYLSFESLRVYDYGDDTLLDGFCVNAFSEPLYGAFKLEYKDKGGTSIAGGILFFDDDAHLIPVGRTRVYATIDTDMRVDTLPILIQKEESLRPYADAADTQ